MPSPLGHSCASLLLGTVAEKRGWIPASVWWQAPLAVVIIGNLPDIDLLLSWLISGNPTHYHQQYTHNIWMAILVGLLLAFLVKNHRIWAGAWGFTLVGLHVLLDSGVGPLPGRSSSLGLWPLWPLSEARLGLPTAVVPMLHYGTPDQILTWKNLGTLFYELILFGTPLAILLWRRN